MSDDTLARDQLRAFVERAERLNGEKDAINSDLSELFKEAKGCGYDVPTIKTVLKIRKQDHSERMEKEAILELYLSALGMVAAPAYDYDEPRAPARAHVENIEQFDADGVEIEPQPAPRAAQMPSGAGDTPAIVGIATSPAGAEGIVDRQPIQPETANDETPSVEGINAPHQTVAADANVGGEDVAASLEIETLRDDDIELNDAGKSVEAPASAAPIYADPGVVTDEYTPPQPVKRHPISAAFADLGQDTKALNDAIYTRFKGVAEPIVKIGPMILDGWARYTQARALLINYPVVQYAGTDLLADAINWNLASRKLTQGQIDTVITRLVKLYPDREQEILGMFDAEVAEAAQ